MFIVLVRGPLYTQRAMVGFARALLVSAVVFLAWLPGFPAAASAQAYVPAASLHPLIFEAYVGYQGLLLSAPRVEGLLSSQTTVDGQLSSEFPSQEVRRLAAYGDFRRSLRNRCKGVVEDGASREQRRQEKQRLMAGIGKRLSGFPGASLVQQGGVLLRRIEDSTHLPLEGFRLSMRVDEAVEGKLALKVQKNLN
jgi:hypothetical protein